LTVTGENEDLRILIQNIICSSSKVFFAFIQPGEYACLSCLCQ
jgi:hypothetical protein